MSTLSFHRIDDEVGLLGIEAEWRTLFVTAGSPSPFLDFDWVLLCWRQRLAMGGHPLVALVRDKGRLVLAIALEMRRYRLVFRRYLGLTSLFPHYDDGLVHPDGDAPAWLAALRRGLRRSPRDTAMVLTYLPAHSRFAQLALPNGIATEHAHSSIAEVGQGYAAYLSRFDGKTRNQISRMERRLGLERGEPMRLSTASEFDADLDWLLAQKRVWTPPSGRKLRDWVTDPRSESDLRRLGRDWIETGRMKLGIIGPSEGRLAGGFLFCSGKHAVFYLTTYDPVASRASPGRIVALKFIEWAAANGYELLDFMAGKWEWKDRLRTGEYIQYRLKLPLG